MSLPMPRVLADENVRAEAAQCAKEVGAISLGIAIFAIGFTGLVAVFGHPNQNGGT